MMPPIPHHRVQQAVKQVLTELTGHLTTASTEATIAAFAARRLAELGYPDTWYHDCPAYVLLGSRSRASISGLDYVPSDEAAGEHNLVTVDLSPRDGKLWGDCARSFVIEHGQTTSAPSDPAFQDGLDTLSRLHEAVRGFATPTTTFAQLHHFANDHIQTLGYTNLDFLGNVGHSIETRLEDRRYVDAQTDIPLGEVHCFTFEPHIGKADGPWGFKHEEIYYFNAAGEACVL